MPEPIVVLIGAGVHRRAELLRQRLHPRWRTILHATDIPGEDVGGAVAAVAMPDAIHWRTAMPNLRLLQLPGAGLDGLDVTALPPGCAVCTVHEHEGSIAEYVFTCLLHRQGWLDQGGGALRRGEWLYFDRIGGEIRPSFCGSTFGIVGFGRIGQRCARIAHALNMRVIVYTRRVPPPPGHEGAKEITFLATVEEVAQEADQLLIACPLTPQTRGLMGASVLARMKPHAILINVARGEVVDEAALYDVCAAGRIGGAILDVWYQYPSDQEDRVHGSRFPFHALRNVTVTPHLAANTADMVSRRWRFIAANLNRLLHDEPLENLRVVG